MKYILISILLLGINNVYGQSLHYSYPDSLRKQDSIIRSNVVKEPEFPGGERELMTYVHHKVDSFDIGHTFEDDMPKTKVIMRFIINEDGSVSGVWIVKSINAMIDRQVLKMVKSFPRFKPALDINGKPTKAVFMFPLQFEFSK